MLRHQTILFILNLVICYSSQDDTVFQNNSEVNQINPEYIKNLNHIRTKRAKYFSYPSRFYRLPPPVYPVKGAFSVTPPPNWQEEGPNNHPYRSKRPDISNDLRDEDISNILNHLSKKDLDKLLQFAGGRKAYESGSFDDSRPPKQYQGYRDLYNEKYKTDKNVQYEFNGNLRYGTDSLTFGSSIPPFVERYPTPYPNHPQTNQLKLNSISHFDSDINSEINNIVKDSNFIQNMPAHVYGHLNSGNDINDISGEEKLPPPVNLRDEIHEASYTNNVPKVVKPEYPLENFGKLPLMNTHDSKLDSVSSYHVPHYTITSPSKTHNSQSSESPAPNTSPGQVASHIPREQSEANLKAVRIWAHKSTGTAYYLHEDGTLSLEKPK